ncbi:replication protein [Klebsiella pneumoniae]|uniref:replication protein n=1 Tax=Klebsiella pneumoniae TaxID=573 RepID=UPI0039BAA539|nr:replication protein [Klebsiella pneumoniae]
MKLYDKDADLSMRQHKAVIRWCGNRVNICVKSAPRENTPSVSTRTPYIQLLKPSRHRNAWTLSKWRSMRDRLFSLNVDATIGIPYFLTLKPITGITPDCFSKALRAFTRYLTTAKNTHWFYCVEWGQHQPEPHIHFLIKVNSETTKNKIMDKWIVSMNKVIPDDMPPEWELGNRQHFTPVYNTNGIIDYMAKKETKLDDFNRMANKSQYDWSQITVWGCSNEWIQHKITTETISLVGFHAVRRVQKASQASKKYKGKDKRQIQRTLKRQSIERSSITPFSSPLNSNHGWSLTKLISWKESEVERKDLLTSQIRRTSSAQNQLLRMLRRARVIVSRAQRESGGYDILY